MRSRMRRYALVLGVLAGLAVAPVVSEAMRDDVFDTRQASPTANAGTSDVTAPERDGAGGGPARDGSAGGAKGRDAELPVFTHRSARLSDVTRRPTSLRIVALGVHAPIVAMGTDASGELDVPRDAATVAWYRAGSVPGAAGSSVLAAHVDYDGERGVFFALDHLRPGDTVRVAFTDGSSRTFDVVSRRRYLKTALPVRELFSRNGPPVLTLITCGGAFNPSTGHYEDNTVVQAALR